MGVFCFFETTRNHQKMIGKLILLIIHVVLVRAGRYIKTCDLDYATTVAIEDAYNLRIHQTSMTISYDTQNVTANTISENTLEVSLKAAHVDFSGYIIVKNQTFDRSKTFASFETKRIIVQAHVDSKNPVINCNLTLSENYNLRSNLTLNSQNAVVRLAESCILQHACEELKFLKLDNQNVQVINGNISVIAPKYGLFSNSSTFDDEDFTKNLNGAFERESARDAQKGLNTLLDFVIGKTMDSLVYNNSGILTISPYNKTFQTGILFWKFTAEVGIGNGTFENLKTLKRVGNICLSNHHQHFAVAAAYKLSKGHLELQNYTLRYGFLKISGNISAEMNDLTIYANVSMDFRHSPCKTVPIMLEIQKPSKFEIHVTGLSIFSNFISKVLSYLLPYIVLPKLREGAHQYIETFDCEELRHLLAVNSML